MCCTALYTLQKRGAEGELFRFYGSIQIDSMKSLPSTGHVTMHSIALLVKSITSVITLLTQHCHILSESAH